MYIVTLVKIGPTRGVKSVETFGPYDSHAEAMRARSRIHMDRVYGKGFTYDHDSAHVSEVEVER